MFEILLTGLAVGAAALLSSPAGRRRRPDREAAVLAAFGASRPEALRAVLNVERKAREAFPDLRIEVAFTSRFVRSAWRARAEDTAWRAEFPGVPEWLYRVKSPLAALADLSDDGCSVVAVQPLHVYAGEEYLNLRSCVDALGAIRTIKPKQQPFNRLSVGRPALGAPGVDHPYQEDLERAVKALASDFERAGKSGSALVYMGHGNRFFSSGIYLELEDAMRRAFPGQPCFVGVVEGFPGLDRILPELGRLGIQKVTLVPFLLVLGEHALNDMAGDGPSSWKSVLESEGIETECVLRGLGETGAWADIYVRHLADALNEARWPLPGFEHAGPQDAL